MNHLELLRKEIKSNLKKTQEVLRQTRKDRDDSPSAMESHSDTSRSKLERDATLHELRIKKLKAFLETVPEKTRAAKKVGMWNLVEVEVPTGLMRIVIVPEGLGGIFLDDVRCISDKTSLGAAIVGKKQKDSFEFNSTRGVVRLIE